MQVMMRFFVCPKCKKESGVLFHTFQWVDEKGFKPPHNAMKMRSIKMTLYTAKVAVCV